MKRGRTSWVDGVPRGTLRWVNAAIDAGALSARAVFDRYNLTRWARLSTFRKYATNRRRDRASRKGSGFGVQGSGPANRQSSTVNRQSSAGPANTIQGAVNELITMTLETARAEIAGGRVGKVKLSSLLGQLREIKEFFDIDLAVEQRAAELHEREMEKAVAKLDVMETAHELNAKQVAEIKRKVLGL